MPPFLRSLLNAVERFISQGRLLLLTVRSGFRRLIGQLFGRPERPDPPAHHEPPAPSAPPEPGTRPPAASPSRTAQGPPKPHKAAHPKPHGPAPHPEAFVEGSFRHGLLARDYRLYIPPSPFPEPASLVVMLHGCKQNPEDFAAGTRMNERAREEGFFVLYPGQSVLANPARCWNWFSADNLEPGRGEAGLIMGLIDEVLAHYPIDPHRVYVAGISAGGAMAANLAKTYPDRFAGVGIHSGVPAGVADDVISGLAAMRGKPTRLRRSRPSTPDAIDGTREYVSPGSGVPTIVFHGDKDKVSAPVNADRITAAALNMLGGDDAAGSDGGATSADGRGRGAGSGHPGRIRPEGSGGRVAAGSDVAPADDPDAAPLVPSRLPTEVDRGKLASGRTWTRAVYTARNGKPLVEQWTVHDFGHAWSGGSPAGSYTDADGPDATREMLRFFHAIGAREAAKPAPLHRPHPPRHRANGSHAAPRH